MYVTSFIGLGSNLGDRVASLRRAIVEVAASESTCVTAVSSIYETVAIGPPQPDYLNAVVAVETGLSARALLERLLEIEVEAGRVRPASGERNAPRPLDCDLLLHGDEQHAEPDLIVPHPRMHERAFVLEPLCEIAPALIHPTMDRSVAELARAVHDPTRVRRFDRTGPPKDSDPRVIVTGVENGSKG